MPTVGRGIDSEEPALHYKPMGVRERRLRRGLVLVLLAVAWLSRIVINDEFIAWAITWGAAVGLGIAAWSLLATAPSRGDVRAARAAEKDNSATTAT